MVERFKYEYHGWQFTVYTNGTIQVTRKGENRVYELGEMYIRIEQKREYVYLYLLDGGFIQVKFEQDDFLVIDEFTKSGNHVDIIGSHVFAEDLVVSN